MLTQTYAIIMAGGKGERFWPLSTSANPKQFLTVFGGKPLLAAAVDYLDGLIDPDRIFVITSAELVAATRAVVPRIPPGNIVGEPFGRDTAAACALGSALVGARDPDGVMVVMTADHVIGDLGVFQATLRDGVEAVAHDDVLMTIGIVPSGPSTGFGYIEAGEALERGGTTAFFRARRFVEKPDPERARQYLQAGCYFWNAGIFVWSAKSFQRALARHQPALREMAERVQPLANSDGFDACLRDEYDRLDRISVDYAIMERAENIVVARATFRWDDVGAWTALANHFPADAEGNVVIGSCESMDSGSNVVVSERRLTALIGVRDLVVVQADGVTLICRKDMAQDVKRLVSRLRGDARYGELL